LVATQLRAGAVGTEVWFRDPLALAEIEARGVIRKAIRSHHLAAALTPFSWAQS
jgi:hypothetical protein